MFSLFSDRFFFITRTSRQFQYHDLNGVHLYHKLWGSIIEKSFGLSVVFRRPLVHIDGSCHETQF